MVAVLGMAVSEYLLPALSALTAWTQAPPPRLVADIDAFVAAHPCRWPIEWR